MCRSNLGADKANIPEGAIEWQVGLIKPVQVPLSRVQLLGLGPSGHPQGALCSLLRVSRGPICSLHAVVICRAAAKIPSCDGCRQTRTGNQTSASEGRMASVTVLEVCDSAACAEEEDGQRQELPMLQVRITSTEQAKAGPPLSPSKLA